MTFLTLKTTSRLLACSALALALGACATQQENPNYQYSSKYNGQSGQAVQDYATYNGQSAQTINASAQSYSANSYADNTYQSTTSSRTAEHHACLNRETNRELLGGAIGGTVGALAGKKLIGGTKGTVIGAGLGGAAGYGIGDMSTNCEPAPTQAHIAASAPAVMITEEEYQARYGSQNASYGGSSAVIAAPTDSAYAGEAVTGTPGWMAMQGETATSAAPTYAPATQSAAMIAAPQTAPVMSTGSTQVVDYDYSQNMISANQPAMATAYEETRVIAPSIAVPAGSYTVQQGDTIYSLARTNCLGVSEVQKMNGLNANFAIKIGQSLSLPASRC